MEIAVFLLQGMGEKRKVNWKVVRLGDILVDRKRKVKKLETSKNERRIKNILYFSCSINKE